MKEKFEVFIEKHWRAVVIVVALLYIGSGAFQLITGIEIDPSKMRNIEIALMITAAFAFLYGKRKERESMDREKAKQEEENQAKKEEDDQAIIEEDISDKDSN